MRTTILSYEERTRNARLKEIHSKKINNLLVSGTTGQLEDWNVEEVLTNRPISDKDRLAEYEWENTIGKYTEGHTYLEVEQFNNTYNNFR